MMPYNPITRGRINRFSPRVIMITTLIVSFTGILFILKSVTKSNQTYHNLHQHYNSVQKLHGQVLRIDEILTMSCWVASTTGDRYWADRYNQHVPKLEKTLKKLIEMSPANTHHHIKVTSDSNSILVAHEYEALAAVKNGDTAKALKSLTHPEYAEHKSRYSEGMRLLQESIDVHFNEKINQELQSIYNQEFTVFLVSIGLAIFWVLIYRVTNLWQTSVEHYQEVSKLMETSLRERIDENAELAHKRGLQVENLRQALLHTERQERKRLARIVHDDLQQLLVALRLKSAIFRDRDSTQSGGYEELVHIADEAIKSAREIIFRLTLPEDKNKSFMEMIKGLVLQFNKRYDLFISLDVSLFEEPQRSEVSVLVYQAIRELLFNIVKHAQVDSATLIIKKESGYDLYGVKDEGIGFDLESLKTNANYLRSGLGLLGMRNHLALIGGEVSISSKQAQGTEIWIKIPTATQNTQSGNSETDLITHKKREDNYLKVFVVDDNEALRGMIVQLINGDESMHVIGEASSGPQAVELAQQLDFDLLLIDYSLPGYNGAQALKYIKEIKPNFTAIGFTSFDLPETISSFEDAGTSEVIIKGDQSDQLLEVCKSYRT